MAEVVNNIQGDWDMAKAVRYLLLTAEAWVYFQDSVQGSYGGQTGTHGFFSSISIYS
jgi:hypothetical protein